MTWNTALDGSGNTYYWNEKGESTYEKPADFDPGTAQSAGSYSQYAGNGGGGGYGAGGYANGGYANGGGYATGGGYDYYSSIGLQYSRPVNTNYKDVQDGEADRPDCDATAEFWQKNDVKVYGGSPPPVLSFEAANLPPQLMDAVAKAGFATPSVIQAQTWPAAMAKRDVIGVAKTGSGKTLGFLVPGFLNILQAQPNPQMGPSILVLAPTRELAMQIDVEAQKFGAPIGIRSVCCYGGASKGSQLSQMRGGVHCIIGTPGRVNDFREGGQLRLGQVAYLVMDEADRMLDMGFEPQIRSIAARLTCEGRQTLFFTATWPSAVRKLASAFLRRDRLVQVTVGRAHDELAANKDIVQHVEIVPTAEARDAALIGHINRLSRGAKVLIFCSTKRSCEGLARAMARQIGCEAIHGDKEQHERERTLANFRSGASPILVATDVAARGLDIKDIALVVNYDFPSNIEDYVHRIGRTGRAGARGVAVTLMTPSDARHARPLLRILREAQQDVPSELEALAETSHRGRGARAESPRQGRRATRRARRDLNRPRGPACWQSDATLSSTGRVVRRVR